MTSPGPHAFVLVVQAGRITTEERDTIDHFVQHFGDGMYSHLIVLFTRKDDLEKDGKTIDDYVRTVPQELANILQKCKNRYVSFDNTAINQSEKDQDVKRLLEMIEKVLQENNGHCYTNEMYQEAETAMKKRMAMIRKAEEQKREKEKRELQRDITAKYEREMASLGRYLSTLEQKLHDKEKASSNNNKIESVKTKMEKLKRKRDNELEQSIKVLEEKEISDAYLRKLAREQSEKGSISLILEGLKNIACGLALPFQKFFS